MLRLITRLHDFDNITHLMKLTRSQCHGEERIRFDILSSPIFLKQLGEIVKAALILLLFTRWDFGGASDEFVPEQARLSDEILG